jgi:FG-GAP-like repeat
MVCGHVAAAPPAYPAPTFSDYVEYAADAEPNSLAVGDVTGDGRADAVLSLESHSETSSGDSLVVFAQRQDGTLVERQELPAPRLYPGSGTVAIGDVNGDGASDVLVSTSQGLEVYYQRGGGLLQPELLSTSPAPADDSLIADVDGDGRNEIVVSSPDGTFLMTPEGTPTYSSRRISPEPLYSPHLGDLNGDGLLDLTGLFMGLRVLYQQSDGSSSPTR